MTERRIFELCWIENPYLYKNNRGMYWKEWIIKNGKINKIPVRYGFPPPPPGRKENDLDKCGGDYIGPFEITITEEMIGRKIAVFKNIEIKTIKDKLKKSQIRFHNWLLSIGGLSEIHMEQKDMSIKIIKKMIDI